ncbi:MAG: EAL domain-containing protein, partial [Rhizobacter sp.]|nr:EAL domain-containing protein [Rhizobacter sp.]
AFASYVALDLARRVRTRDRLSKWLWMVGGSLVMGTGIWSMHFVGMLAFSLPVELGYEALITFVSWIAGVVVSALALHIAGRDRLTPTTLFGGAAAMGSGICAMHYTGMAALQMAPGIVWNTWLVAASALVAWAASAAALLMFFGMRRLKGARRHAAQAGAALLMGAAISGMHYTGMAAAGFPAGSICLSADGLGGHNLGTLVVLATAALLSITLFTSVLDARMQARAQGLTRSLQAANEELRRLAFRDALTGLPNRTLLEDRLEHAKLRLDRAREQQGRDGTARLALLFIDLDGFKPVNDCYGHAAGDAVLRQVTRRLQMLAREADTLARVGGDEFVLLVDDIAAGGDALLLAGRILAAMRLPFELAPHRKVTLSCSIGVAIYPDHAQHGKLMACADAAMYNAKRAGGSTCAVFESHMHQGTSVQMELLQALRDALEQRQLCVHYQPKVNARTGRLSGVEALLRWHHPTHGPISPAQFIPLAERFGLIVPIGNWVIDEVMRQLACWSAQGRRLRVSINLSGHQLRHLEVVERLSQAMLRHEVDANQVICEITESVAMEDLRATQHVLANLSAAGVGLSIDDFGTGHSSLASLRQLHIQELKIDRSFVHDVATTADAHAIVDAVVHLARALGLRVVAEGVETRAQRDVLVALGCDELQGYYFARPMPPQDLLGTRLRTADEAEEVDFSPSLMMMD